MSKKNVTSQNQLSVEVVVNLCNRWKSNRDQKAFNELLNAYMWVIELVINKFNKCVLDHADLEAEGCLGILDAVNCYDSNKGIFTKIAYSTVLNRIINAVKNSYAVKISKEKLEKRNKLEKAREHYFCEHGMYPPYYELAELTGMEEKVVYEEEFQPLSGICIDDYDFEHLVDSDENASVFGNDTQGADYAILKEETEHHIQQALNSKLTKRDAKIIRCAFGFEGQELEELTDRELGEKFNLTSARIGQIKKDSIKLLKECTFFNRA